MERPDQFLDTLARKLYIKSGYHQLDAEFRYQLADAMLQQFPYFKLDELNRAQIEGVLGLPFVRDESKKMQYWLNEQHLANYLLDAKDRPQAEVIKGKKVVANKYVRLRRIIRNIPTGYTSSPISQWLKDFQTKISNKPHKGLSSDVVCRAITNTPGIMNILTSHYHPIKNPFSLMYVYHEMQGEIERPGQEIHVRTPGIVVLGANDEEIRQLREFTRHFQKPTEKELELLANEGGIIET